MKRRDRGILIGMSALAVLAFSPKHVTIADAAQAAAGPEARQPHEAREQADNVLFVRPAGWERRNNVDGTVTLIPPGLTPGRDAALLIFQGGETPGMNLHAWFDHAWRALLQANQARVLSGGEAKLRRADGFDVISTSATIQSATGKRSYVAFFAAAPGTRTEAMLFAADRVDLYRKYIAAVSRLWETMGFANFQSAGGQPMTLAAPGASAPQGQGDLRVESIYQSFTPLRGSGTEDYGFTFLILYSNGLVYKGGSANFVEGPANLDLANESVREYNLGTYETVGDQIRIAWSGAYTGRTDVYRRQGDKLGELEGPFAWRRLPSVDGLKLQGTYVRPADPAIWITFAPDGTFRDVDVVKVAGALAFLNRQLDPPPGGSGTYTFQDYTLTLRYTNGQTARMFFFVLPDDNIRRPRQLLLNTYFFDLQQ